MDEDDELSLRSTAGLRRVINPPSPQRVSAVRNWNSAAASAQGDLLFVIADDLAPPPHWDSTLRAAVASLDPNKFAFVICVGDLDKGPELIRHPVVSRQFYSRFGLFGPEFSGVYCDDDITLRAYNRAVVLDGKALILEHRHPTIGEYEWSLSQKRMNAGQEYKDGLAALEQKWNRVQRVTRFEYFKPPPGSASPDIAAAAWRMRLKTLGIRSAIARRLGGLLPARRADTAKPMSNGSSSQRSDLR